MWYALGLYDPYKEGHRLKFKNVAICDNEDIAKATFIIWDRVSEPTEKEDIDRIKTIIYAPITQLQLEKMVQSHQNRVNEIAELKGAYEFIDKQNDAMIRALNAIQACCDSSENNSYAELTDIIETIVQSAIAKHKNK